MAEFTAKEKLFDFKIDGKTANALWSASYDAGLLASGALPIGRQEIIDDSIKPECAYIELDTEGKAPQDELVKIDIASTNNGMELFLRAANTERAVTLRHFNGLHGIRLKAGKNRLLDTITWVKLKRNGDYWEEVINQSVLEPFILPQPEASDQGKLLVVKPDASFGLEQRIEILSEPVTVTVGANGNFKSINAALTHLTDRYLPRQTQSGVRAEIRLLKGFEMQEQVFVRNTNLGWIGISGEDDETLIDETYNTTLDGDIATGYTAVFCGYQCTMPVIKQLFRVKNPSDDSNKAGYMIYASSGAFTTGSGFNNVSGQAISAHNGSTLFANNVQAKNSRNTGLLLHQSQGWVYDIDVSGSRIGLGLHLNSSAYSLIQIKACECTAGVEILSGSTLFANKVTINDCKFNAAYINENSLLRAYELEAHNCAGEYAILLNFNSSISAGNLKIHNAAGNAFWGTRGGVGNIENVDIKNYAFSGCTAYCRFCLMLEKGVVRKNSADSSTDLRVGADANLGINNTQGGTNQAPNVRTNHGLILR